jgi:hypothetical protein
MFKHSVEVLARYKRSRCGLLDDRAPGEEGVIMVALTLGRLFTAAFADQPIVVELFTLEGCFQSLAADAAAGGFGGMLTCPSGPQVLSFVMIPERPPRGG